MGKPTVWCLIQSINATKLVQGYHKSWLSIVVDKDQQVEVVICTCVSSRSEFKVLDFSFKLMTWWKLILLCCCQFRRICSFENTVSLPCFRWWKLASGPMEVKWTASRQCILHTNTCNRRDILLLNFFKSSFAMQQDIRGERLGPILNKNKSHQLDLCIFNQRFQFPNLHVSPVREKNN